MTDKIAVSYSGYPGTYAVDIPDACPICHRHSQLQAIHAEAVERNSRVQVVYRCAYQGCLSFFIGYYGPPGQDTLISVRPIKPKTSQFPESVAKISPKFISVFAEAEEAAQSGLSQIAGPGYRKAFEFLVKDYAISLAPDKLDEIRRTFSGAVVKDYITDSRIQAVAKRSLWLGNDETHYLRIWTGHDVNDLVTLIKLTVSWIEIEFMSKSYVEQMPE
jgi:hypothetical protein